MYFIWFGIFHCDNRFCDAFSRLCINFEFQLSVFVIENPCMCQHNYFYRIELCSALIIQFFVSVCVCPSVSVYFNFF